jgi:hypothetical protein
MKPKLSSLPMLLQVAVLTLIVGCASRSAYVNPQGPDTAVNAGQINIQDFAAAADTFVNEILERVSQGQLPSSRPGKPAIMAISRITNKTLQHVDIDQLVKKIRVQLNRSGRILTTTTLAYGEVEDPLAKQTQEQLQAQGKTDGPLIADYTLSGSILDDIARKSRMTTQASYIFQLSLTDRNGIALWESEYIVTKQGRKAAVSW